LDEVDQVQNVSSHKDVTRVARFSSTQVAVRDLYGSPKSPNRMKYDFPREI